MGFFDYFTNRTETREKHKLKELQTRYYKTTKNEAIKVVTGMIESSPNVELLDVSEERGEIIAQIKRPKKAFMVVSIIMVFPQRTAIDFTITTDTFLPLDFGNSKREELRMYEKLGKQFEFAGTGLGE